MVPTVKFLQMDRAKVHFVIMGNQYRTGSASPVGLIGYLITDWEGFEKLGFEDQGKIISTLKPVVIGKNIRKVLQGRPGSVYTLETTGEEDNLAFYTNSAKYICRLDTPYSQRWDTQDYVNGKDARAEAMAKKDQSLYLRDNMTLRDIRTLYQSNSPAKRAVILQTFLQEIIS